VSAGPKRILCAGMPVRDLIFTVPQVPARGQKLRAEAFQEVSGGNAPNAAVAIARLGGLARLCGPMGAADEPTQGAMLAAWRREGIDVTPLQAMPGTTTPISSIMIDAEGERTIATHRDQGLWQVVLHPPEQLLDGVDALLVENRCMPFILPLCTAARQRGLPVVVDADRVMTLQDALLPVASHVIFSADALRATTGLADLADGLAAAAAVTTALLAVTDGAAGTLWRDAAGALRHLPAFPARAVDTLGAGDAFHGAFALAIAEGLATEAALRLGAATAALKCQRPGGIFGSPQRVEVERLLA
jgi:sugar/nucleoside kinase (ribokinase family)